MKNTFFYWLIGILFLLLPFTASAYQYDQSQMHLGSSFSATAFAPVGQSFVPRQDFILGVMLKLSDAGGAGLGNWAEIRLRKDRIDGEVVAVSEEFYLEDCFNFIADPGCGLGGGNPAQITFLFEQPVAVDAGNVYVMELVVDAMGDGLLVAYYPGDVYSDGGYYKQAMPSLDDLWFRTLAPGRAPDGIAPESMTLMHGAAQPHDVVTIADTSLQLGYCRASGQDTRYEWIQSVSLNGALITSGDDQGYVKHEQSKLDIIASKPNTLLLTPGFRSGQHFEYWSAWVDWNRDGQFRDEERMVSSRSDSPVLTTFDIPAGATAGLTLMRVAMRFDAPQENCGEFCYGEVEDFIVQVSE